MENLTKKLALALFSGGLDSILAAKLIERQGLEVICLHFYSPFFGDKDKAEHWSKVYGLNIKCIDIGEGFTQMLMNRPQHGLGSVLNPCVDCKIFMLKKARELMGETGACCIVSGEVLGQRPMSQRRDTLNIIRRDADVRDFLVRPLSALHLDPTEAERSGIINRELLMSISGRGRKQQMALAAEMGITEIPTPAGGCKLTEHENARSYWPIMKHLPCPHVDDFRLANTGRQFWLVDDIPYWLTIGRNQNDNDIIMQLATSNDLLIKARDFPGPISILRNTKNGWPPEIIQTATALAVSYSPKAVKHFNESGALIAARLHKGSLDSPGETIEVQPSRAENGWKEPSWAETQPEIKEFLKKGI